MTNQIGIIPEIKDSFAEICAIRHDIHTHPELGYEEYRTSKLVSSYLTDWGYKVTQNIAKTGVVGTLTVGDGVKKIGIRAEMDALPIDEETRLDYASSTQGVMHACGHDGHVATLLAAAKYLAKTKIFSGTVHLIFQPSEERDAGAKGMIDAGLFNIAPCDVLYTMHNYPSPDLNLGQMRLCHGEIMASADSIVIQIKGKGCHAASPHFGNDSIVATASIVQALQTIISRNTDPLKSGVLSITSIHAGNTFNIIPEEVELKLTIRTLDEELRDLIKKRINDIVQGQAKSFNIHAKVTEQGAGYPVLINEKITSQFAQEVALKYFGKDYISNVYQPILASDDFAFMAQKIPSCYINVGNGDSAALHNSHYNFNDELIPIMASFWGYLVEEYLA